jgi:hypothetical protein
MVRLAFFFFCFVGIKYVLKQTQQIKTHTHIMFFSVERQDKNALPILSDKSIEVS